MKIEVDPIVLKNLLAVTQTILDSGDVYPYFNEYFSREQLDQIISMSVTLRECIDLHLMEERPSTQTA